MWNYLIDSFFFVLSPIPLLYVALGVFLGITVGAIPGLTGSMLIALTVPLTFYMDNDLALILLVAMYVGAISGGLITATLLRMPGTPASVVTTFDGYPLAKSGKSGRAIGIGIMSSFVGGLISWIFLITLSPPLAKVALKFGPFEFFSLVLMALVMISAVGEGSILKGFISGLLGLLAACPGMDALSGTLRLEFGFDEMAAGFSLIPVLIGLFGISQIITDLTNIERKVERIPISFKGMFLSLKDLKDQATNLIRSSVLGTWVGILPGIGANIGSLLAYSAAKSSSKKPQDFGKGSEEGIVASEAANNATIGGALIPLVTLGIPGSLVDAILLGALILHDLTPGPLLFRDDPQLVYNIMTTAFVGNVIMFFFMLFASVIIARVIDIPKTFLIPTILAFCVVGTYALNNRTFDVWVMFGFGILGFLMEKTKIPLGPFVIGLILEPIAEKNIRSGLMLSDGSFLPVLTRPLSLAFVILALITLVWTLYRELKHQKALQKAGL
ncbi:MAG: tripartite tricarboxylate transporter permease [Deltaproteobacteria bacterium]|nr:tripartite tricarboxylate transporter permease [Deltaproteobacteria bacterium]MBW1960413.1 tripartite tricarboxylate transporter permease [Deltaproteobacteria bacterium]MBW2153421.1 tripartite tricarboxylate transporter permease [Deltaproteobacteria bacterium]